jgi:hypothetical protein
MRAKLFLPSTVFILALVFGACINVSSVGADGAENEMESALRKWRDDFNGGTSAVYDLAPDLIANYGISSNKLRIDMQTTETLSDEPGSDFLTTSHNRDHRIG